MIDSIINYTIDSIPIFFLLVANWIRIRAMSMKLKELLKPTIMFSTSLDPSCLHSVNCLYDKSVDIEYVKIQHTLTIATPDR